MNYWSPKFQIYFSGSLINQSIAILTYRNRSLQKCVCICLLQRKCNSSDFTSYIIFSNLKIWCWWWIVDIRLYACVSGMQKIYGDICNMYGIVSGALHFNQFIHHLKTIKKFIKLDSALGYTQENPHWSQWKSCMHIQGQNLARCA